MNVSEIGKKTFFCCLLSITVTAKSHKKGHVWLNIYNFLFRHLFNGKKIQFKITSSFCLTSTLEI